MNAANQLLDKIERARMWSYFHKDWLLQIRVALRRQLPPDYAVFVESETVLITPDRTAGALLPDLAIARGTAASVAVIPSGATAAVIEADETCETETHYTLVIRRAPNQEVVAVVELLSPSNKGQGNRFDQQKFLRKRAEYLDAGVNLLEIDALKSGERTLPPALAALEKYPRTAWTLAQAGSRRKYRGWGWGDHEALPVVDWMVDAELTVMVDLGDSLETAAEFNSWRSFVSANRPPGGA